MSIKNDMIEKAKSFLRGRKFAYHQVFNPENLYTKEVLTDLAKFCQTISLRSTRMIEFTQYWKAGEKYF